LSPDDEHASAAQGLPLGGASGLKYSARQILQPILSSVNPELRPFKAHEGKMIQYAGWADTAIAPENGLNYYRKVTQTIGDPRDFYRIFMVPGMAHCSGGAGSLRWLAGLSTEFPESCNPMERARDREVYGLSAEGKWLRSFGS
jgi:hypothetical protein